MEQLTNNWVKMLEFTTIALNKTRWHKGIKAQIVSDKLNVTEEQVYIFIRYFEHEKYKCNMNFDIVDIGYYSIEYMNSLMDNFYL